MGILSDIETAQSCTLRKIKEIAAAGVDPQYLELHGKYKAKIDCKMQKEVHRPDSKLILVAAITPTPAGEGKPTTSAGLAGDLRRIGKNAMAALRAGGAQPAPAVVRVGERGAGICRRNYARAGGSGRHDLRSAREACH